MRSLESLQHMPAGQTISSDEIVELHLQVTDADGVWRQALDAGAAVEMALEDQFWGDRYGVLRDPFGHRWSISTARESPSSGSNGLPDEAERRSLAMLLPGKALRVSCSSAWGLSKTSSRPGRYCGTPHTTMTSG